jgi:hypothetical protein
VPRHSAQVILTGPGKVFAAVFPKGIEGTDSHRVVALLQEAPQPLAFRSAVLCIFRIIDVDLQFSREELREACIGEIQDEAAPSNKIHEVVDESRSMERIELMVCPQGKASRLLAFEDDVSDNFEVRGVLVSAVEPANVVYTNYSTKRWIGKVAADHRGDLRYPSRVGPNRSSRAANDCCSVGGIASRHASQLAPAGGKRDPNWRPRL